MDRVSDVLAFVAGHGEYWTEFLSGQEYGAELSDDEARALDAAKEHVEDAVCDILILAGERAAAKLAEDGFVRRRFQRAAAKQNRYVVLSHPAQLSPRLYYAKFSLEQEVNGPVKLFAVMVVKKGYVDELNERLNELGIPFAMSADGFAVYSSGIEIVQDRPFQDLAEAASDAMRGLVSAIR